MVDGEVGERFFDVCTVATHHKVHKGVTSDHASETFICIFDEISKFGLAVDGAHLVDFHDGGEGRFDCCVEIITSETVASYKLEPIIHEIAAIYGGDVFGEANIVRENIDGSGWVGEVGDTNHGSGNVEVGWVDFFIGTGVVEAPKFWENVA